MTNIMQTNKINGGIPPAGISVIGPQVSSVQPSTVNGTASQKKSLNREARKRELLKITMEN